MWRLRVTYCFYKTTRKLNLSHSTSTIGLLKIQFKTNMVRMLILNFIICTTVEHNMYLTPVHTLFVVAVPRDGVCKSPV